MSLIIGYPYTSEHYIGALDRLLDFETVSTRKAEENLRCRFLRLPPELRLQVYHAIFASTTNLGKYHVLGTVIGSVERTSKQAYLRSRGLLQSCRAIRSEAQSEFWKLHVINFGLSWPTGRGLNGVSRFLRAISSDTVDSFRQIQITGWWDSDCRCAFGRGFYFHFAIDRKAEKVSAYTMFESDPALTPKLERWPRCRACVKKLDALFESWAHKIELVGMQKLDRTLRKEDVTRVIRMIGFKKRLDNQGVDWDGFAAFILILLAPHIAFAAVAIVVLMAGLLLCGLLLLGYHAGLIGRWWSEALFEAMFSSQRGREKIQSMLQLISQKA